MLCGTYHYNIDPKGRLNFPAKLREDLGSSFMLTCSVVDCCLVVYSMSEWEKLVAKVESLPMGKSRAVRRRLFANAQEVSPDKQGRILIPQELMTYAHLSKEATVLGISNYCEIWDDGLLEQQMNENDQQMLAETVEELGL